MEPIVTYRHSVRGALDEFIEKTKFKGLLRSDAMIEIAASVARHHEEGVQLFPQVYICENTEEFRKQVPDGELYMLGESSDVRQGVTKAMKKCSPLVSRDWEIIIEVNAKGCRFGIFKSSSVPTALSLETTYFSGELDTLPAAIRVSCKRPSVVTFRSDCGKSLTVCFTHDEVSAESLISPADQLAEHILTEVRDEPLREATSVFLVKIFQQALKGSHGTLVSVVDKKWADEKQLPQLFADGVKLVPCVDIVGAVRNLRGSSGNLEAICAPLSYYELVRGMLTFDGITVFSSDGRIIAYNVFVNAPSTTSLPRDQISGARKRAFDVLRDNLGETVLAAFYQSHDGKTEFITQ